MKYGRLTIESTYMKEFKHRNHRYAICKCDCGQSAKIRLSYLKNGKAKSCGCLQKEVAKAKATKHNQCGSRLYVIWQNMKRRCTYHPNYAGRGISVCDEWKMSFEKFFEWAVLTNYSEYDTIDRINNDGNYCPENCRWATHYDQHRNQRSNRYISAFGEEKIISDWIKDSRCQIKTPTTILSRIKNGMSPEDAITRKAYG